MTNVVVRSQGNHAVLPGRHGKGLHNVVGGNRGDHEGQHPVELGDDGIRGALILVIVVTRDDVRVNLRFDQTLDVGIEGHSHEEHKETRVQTVPQGRDEVGGHQRLPGTLVGVALQPALGPLVPGTRQALHVGGELKAQNLNVLHTTPANDLAGVLLVVSLEAKPTHHASTLSNLPGEIVLKAVSEESHPDVPESVQHVGVLSEPGLVVGVGDGEASGELHVCHKRNHANHHSLQSLKPGGGLAPAQIVLVLTNLKHGSSNGVHIILVLKCRTSQDTSEAVHVAKKLQKRWHLLHGKALAVTHHAGLLLLLHRVVLGKHTLEVMGAIVEIVSKRSELHRNHHLGAGEVEDARHVAHVHSVDVGHSHITHGPHEHNHVNILSRHN